MNPRLALVEDDEDLRDEMCFQLGRAGFDVFGCEDGASLDRHLASSGCELVVMDLGLPGEDGLSISARLRASRPGLGLVMLTARGRLQDRLDGLDRGADAYLVKPVDTRELIAVIQTVLRRLAAPASPLGRQEWLLRYRSLEIVSPEGRVISISGMEVILLRELAKTGTEVVARRQLIEALGHDYLLFDQRRLDTAMSRLRHKLEEVSPDKSPIRAVRGVGYVFATPLREDDETV